MGAFVQVVAEEDCVFDWAEHPYADPLQPRVEAAPAPKKSECRWKAAGRPTHF